MHQVKRRNQVMRMRQWLILQAKILVKSDTCLETAMMILVRITSLILVAIPIPAVLKILKAYFKEMNAWTWLVQLVSMATRKKLTASAIPATLQVSLPPAMKVIMKVSLIQIMIRQAKLVAIKIPAMAIKILLLPKVPETKTSFLILATSKTSFQIPMKKTCSRRPMMKIRLLIPTKKTCFLRLATKTMFLIIPTRKTCFLLLTMNKLET
mmetsp:Transcript_14040/g.25342  ORF Transcript_14040/g.25342 Transcript_14040/m.25342 type:complete len:210 (-) Transcript_14040:2339-2968(-)